MHTSEKACVPKILGAIVGQKTRGTAGQVDNSAEGKARSPAVGGRGECKVIQTGPETATASYIPTKKESVEIEIRENIYPLNSIKAI